MSGQSDGDRTSLVRGYLLGTLSREDHDEVARQIAESAEWREALDGERQRLAILDGIPSETPPEGLAASVIAAAKGAESTEHEAWWRWHRISWKEIAATICVAAVAVAVLLPAFVPAREASRRASSQNNLKQLGLIFKMYAN